MIGLPYLRKQISKDHITRIEVMADSMRVGKTTAVKVLGEGLRKRGYQVAESYEDWQSNPYLKKSYEDPTKNFLESQKWFIKRKFEQVRDGGVGDVFIQDVAPEMDYCYAETNKRFGRMSEDHFNLYDEFYHSLEWRSARAPDVLVYLQASDEVLLQRAMDSQREFETVEPEYFLMMKRVNREWLSGAVGNPEYKILEIDTDRLDFASDEGAKERLVEMVIKRLQREE